MMVRGEVAAQAAQNGAIELGNHVPKLHFLCKYWQNRAKVYKNRFHAFLALTSRISDN